VRDDEHYAAFQADDNIVKCSQINYGWFRYFTHDQDNVIMILLVNSCAGVLINYYITQIAALRDDQFVMLLGAN
jgi:hypothetical protein